MLSELYGTGTLLHTLPCPRYLSRRGVLHCLRDVLRPRGERRHAFVDLCPLLQELQSQGQPARAHHGGALEHGGGLPLCRLRNVMSQRSRPAHAHQAEAWHRQAALNGCSATRSELLLWKSSKRTRLEWQKNIFRRIFFPLPNVAHQKLFSSKKRMSRLKLWNVSLANKYYRVPVPYLILFVIVTGTSAYNSVPESIFLFLDPTPILRITVVFKNYYHVFGWPFEVVWC